MGAQGRGNEKSGRRAGAEAAYRGQRYHFVGGHKHADESFQQCAIREVEEELAIAEGPDFLVGEPPLAHLDYIAWSEGAGQQTRYTMGLFAVDLKSDAVRKKVEADPRNRWLMESEIREGRCQDGRPVSTTMASLLGKAGLLLPLPPEPRQL